MKRIFLLLLIAIFSQTFLHAQSQPKREVRSVWLTTAWRLDWPSVTVPASTGNNEAARAAARTTQQNELLAILDRLEAANFNTIYFQVRPMHDAFYRSSLPSEPWSQYISSVRGADPGWSPLGFLIEHAHARGIEVHAWLNPYRYSSSSVNHGTLPTDIAVTHPHWLMDTGLQGDGPTHIKILNPGIPEVRQYIADVVEDIIKNYNVDGIILDDYFYVNGRTTNAMDQAQFDAYNPGGLSRADWRRENVNMMIRDVQARINSISPWVQWGVSPAGVAVGGNSTVAGIYGVRTSPGSDWQRNGIFSSPVAWLRDGTVDYISPQIYWHRNHSTNPYGGIAAWWAEVSNQFGRHFFSSHTKSMSGITAPNTMQDELVAQAQINRNEDRNDAPGMVLFRANQPVSQAVYDALRATPFQRPALTAMYGWKPAPMQGLVTNLAVSGRNLTWNYTPVGDFSVRYAIYVIPVANRNDADAFTSSRFLQGISYTTSFTLPVGVSTATHRIAVAVFDRFGNLFPPRVLGESDATIAPAQLTFPAHQQTGVALTANFTWQAVSGADYYVWQLAHDAAFTQPIASRETTTPSAGLNFASAQRAAAGQCFVKPNTPYFWRVKAIRANAPISISEVRVFNGTQQPVTPLRLVVGTESAAPHGTHLTEAEAGTQLFLGVDANNNPANPLWINRTDCVLTSSNPAVATVSQWGTINTLAGGTVTFTAVRNSDGARGEVTFTVIGEPPIIPLTVVSYDPQGAQEESARPIVRIEFAQPLNEATIAGAITVTDECGRVIEGVQSYHVAANGKSVLHFMFNQDLIPQAVYTVTLRAGVAGANGDVMSEPFTFNFAARPREIISTVVINDFNTAPPTTVNDPMRWLNPGSTGQAGGFNTTATVKSTDDNIIPRVDHTGSMRLNYQWLSSATNGNVVRWHPNTNAAAGNAFPSNSHIQYYLFGDGSGTPVSMMLQNDFGNPLFGYRIVVDWVGWRQITVDVLNDSRVAELGTTGTGAIAPDRTLNNRGFLFLAETVGMARSTELSAMNVSRLRAVQMGDFIQRSAYTVTFGVVGNGTLDAVTCTGNDVASGTQVLHGTDVTFTATPDEDYKIKSWTINGVLINGTPDTYTLSNLTAGASVTVEFELDTSVGVENTFASNLQMFPNPFTDVIHITGAENSVLQIMNVIGTVVHTQQITETNVNIHLRELPAGVYFFRIERNGQAKTIRVVKR